MKTELSGVCKGGGSGACVPTHPCPHPHPYSKGVLSTVPGREERPPPHLQVCRRMRKALPRLLCDPGQVTPPLWAQFCHLQASGAVVRGWQRAKRRGEPGREAMGWVAPATSSKNPNLNLHSPHQLRACMSFPRPLSTKGIHGERENENRVQSMLGLRGSPERWSLAAGPRPGAGSRIELWGLHQVLPRLPGRGETKGKSTVPTFPRGYLGPLQPTWFGVCV